MEGHASEICNPRAVEQADVVIIGAGAAGCAAASELSRQGIRVRMIEARDRIGGRILSHRENYISIPIELGAEFIHGHAPETFRILKRHELPYDGVQGRMVDSDFWNSIGEFMERLRTRYVSQQNVHDRSLREALRTLPGDPETDRMKRVVTGYVEGFHAADSGLVSERVLLREEAGLNSREERQVYRLPHGYIGICGALLSEVTDWEEALSLRQPVTEIRWRQGEALVATPDFQIGADRVLITLPLGVLKAPARAEGSVRFSPELPKREALNRLEMGVVHKVVLRFREPFWSGDFGFAHSEHPLVFPTWWSMKPVECPVLAGWVGGGPSASRLGALAPNELLAEAISSLSQLFSIHRHRIEERLAGWNHHDWSNDPFSRGAYSYVGIDGSLAQVQLAEPVEDTLFFAGEATHFEGQTGTVEGALVSGIRAARQIIESRTRGSLAA